MKRFLISILLLLLTIFTFVYYINVKGIKSDYINIKVDNNELILKIFNIKIDNISFNEMKIIIPRYDIYHISFKELRINKTNILNFKTTLTLEKIIEYIKKDTIDLELKNLSYKFHENIKPVKTNIAKLKKDKKKIIIDFKEKTLLSKYEILEGKLILPGNGIEIKFKLKDIFDKELNKIFKNYIDIKDLQQINGISKLDFDIFVFFEDIDTKYNITFQTNDSEMLFFDRIIEINDLYLIHNNEGIDIKLNGRDKETKIDLFVKEKIDLDNKRQSGKLKIKDFGKITKDFKCNDFEAIFNSEDKNILIDKITGYCKGNNKEVYFKNNEMLINIVDKLIKANGFVFLDNLSLKYDLSYKIGSDNIIGRIFIEKLSEDIDSITNLKHRELKFDLNINNQEVYFPDYKIKYKIKDKKIEIENINILNTFFIEDIYKSKNEKMIIKKEENKIKIRSNNIEINLEKLKKIMSKINLKSTNISKKELERDIELINSKILYKKRKILFNKIKIIINKSKIDIFLKKNKSTINYVINNNGEEIIEGNEITSDILNEILKITNFEKGITSFYLKKGKNTKLFKGNIKQKNVLIKDSLVIANIGRVLNITPMLINPWLIIPSLPSMLENTNIQGYLVENGTANIEVDEDFNQFNIIDFITENPINNFKGKMKIDFEKGSLNGEIKIKFLKTYSKIISFIPLVGQILTGDEGLLTSKVKITGTIKEPIIEVIPLNLSLNFQEGKDKKEEEFNLVEEDFNIF